ncbi:MAG: TRAP transporter small permease subunit [Rhodobacteraceae bacterium]|nr:MAG: TRAP transporter small permease subunit [Paracoccaceae bacterium]
MSPGNGLVAAAFAVSFVTSLIGGALGGWGQVAALVLATAGAAARARPAGVFGVAALSVGLWFALEGGANAILAAMDVRPRNFWREWTTAAHVVATAIVLAVFVLSLYRRPPTPFRAALETSNDIEAVVNRIGRAASWLFVPMMLIIFYDITQRSIINNHPGFLNTVFYLQSAKMQEMQWHLHGALFMLCLGFAYVKDAHVRIELVRDVMAPRTRVWIELLGAALFLFAYCAVLTRYGWNFTERAFLTNERSSAPTGLSMRWIIKSMLPVGFVLLGMTGVSAALRCIVFLFGPTDLKPEANRYAITHHADLPDDVVTQGPITD